MTNSKMLREIIEKRGMKLKFVAEKLGISAYSFSLKLDNKREFKAREISILCELLGIRSLEQKEAIFFAKKVD